MAKVEGFPEAAFEVCGNRDFLRKQTKELLNKFGKMKRELVKTFRQEQKGRPEIVYLVYLLTSCNTYPGACIVCTQEIMGESGEKKKVRNSLWRFNGGDFSGNKAYEISEGEVNGNGNNSPGNINIKLANGGHKYKAELASMFEGWEGIGIYQGELRRRKKAIAAEAILIRMPLGLKLRLHENIVADQYKRFIDLVKPLV